MSADVRRFERPERLDVPAEPQPAPPFDPDQVAWLLDLMERREARLLARVARVERRLDAARERNREYRRVLSSTVRDLKALEGD